MVRNSNIHPFYASDEHKKRLKKKEYQSDGFQVKHDLKFRIITLSWPYNRLKIYSFNTNIHSLDNKTSWQTSHLKMIVFAPYLDVLFYFKDYIGINDVNFP